MKCNVEVVFKSVEKRDGGEFTNSNGEVIKYDSSYLLKIDEVVGNVINERKLKFPLSNDVLYSKFSELKPYSKILLEVDIVLRDNSNARVIPLDVVSQ